MGQHKHLYATHTWKLLRTAQLIREPLCRFCEQEGRVTAATVADHIEPHRGDRAKFFTTRLQSLCKDCHDRTKQRAEIHGYDLRVDLDGMPIDPTHPFNAPSSPALPPPGVGSVSKADRAETGGGHSRALPQNVKGKGSYGG